MPLAFYVLANCATARNQLNLKTLLVLRTPRENEGGQQNGLTVMEKFYAQSIWAPGRWVKGCMTLDQLDKDCARWHMRRLEASIALQSCAHHIPSYENAQKNPVRQMLQHHVRREIFPGLLGMHRCHHDLVTTVPTDRTVGAFDHSKTTHAV